MPMPPEVFEKKRAELLSKLKRSREEREARNIASAYAPRYDETYWTGLGSLDQARTDTSFLRVNPQILRDLKRTKIEPPRLTPVFNQKKKAYQIWVLLGKRRLLDPGLLFKDLESAEDAISMFEAIFTEIASRIYSECFAPVFEVAILRTLSFRVVPQAVKRPSTRRARRSPPKRSSKDS